MEIWVEIFGNFWKFQALNAENPCSATEVMEIFSLAPAQNWALKISENPCYQELLGEFPLSAPSGNVPAPRGNVSAPRGNEISKEVSYTNGFQRKKFAEELEELLGVSLRLSLAVGLVTVRAARQPARHGPTSSNQKTQAPPFASSPSAEVSQVCAITSQSNPARRHRAPAAPVDA